MTLEANIFTNLNTSLYGSYFTDTNLLSYFGKNLNKWLLDVLKSKGVVEKPLIESDNVSEKAHIEGAVYIAKGAVVEPFAFIKGPAFIGEGTHVRQSAYIRGDVFAGKNTVIGHSTEIKSSVMLDDAKAGHFAYIGNSFLSKSVNLGAGTKLANLKLSRSNVKVTHPETQKKLDTGMYKFSCVLGDEVQTGCNSVISPGSLLLPKATVMPCEHFFGTK